MEFESGNTKGLRKLNDGGIAQYPENGSRWSADRQHLDKAHKEYNQAFEELVETYIEKNKITKEQMTPDHANEVLKQVRESKDPRIRDFNNTMRFIRRVYRLRTGRE